MEKHYILTEGDIIPKEAEIRIMGEWIPVMQFLDGQRIDSPVGCEGDFLFRLPTKWDPRKEDNKMTGPQPHLSKLKSDRIEELTKQGLTAKIIAVRLGLTQDGVQLHQVNNGLHVRKSRKKKGGEIHDPEAKN